VAGVSPAILASREVYALRDRIPRHEFSMQRKSIVGSRFLPPPM
jgi:hypothetical protein